MKETKELKDIHSFCISWKQLPDLLRHICGVLNSTFVSTEDVAETNFDDYSFIGQTKYSRSEKLLKMGVA